MRPELRQLGIVFCGYEEALAHYRRLTSQDTALQPPCEAALVLPDDVAGVVADTAGPGGDNGNPLLVIDGSTFRGQGSTGICHSGWPKTRNAPNKRLPGNTEIVVKETYNERYVEVQREAAVYTYLLPYVQGLRRPAFYGFFQRCGSTREYALVLGLEGRAPRSYDELSRDAK